MGCRCPMLVVCPRTESQCCCSDSGCRGQREVRLGLGRAWSPRNYLQSQRRSVAWRCGNNGEALRIVLPLGVSQAGSWVGGQGHVVVAV